LARYDPLVADERSRLPHRLPRLLLVLGAPLLAFVAAPVATAQTPASDPGPVRPIVFPVVGDVSYTDTFGAPRGSGRVHEGQDLMGRKLQELVAAADGTITYLTNANPLGGNMLKLTGTDGWVYTYIHLNNDTPGTDDGQAERKDTFGPGIEKGASVVAGQLVGYMGDSGDAEEAGSHLHFELATPDGVTVNPLASLQAARHVAVAGGAPTSPIARLAGVDRVATALAVSKAGWPDGAEDVVLAAGDRYAEALPASVLAAARNGPLLLTTGPTLAADVSAELTRLRVKRVAVVGSVPQAVADAVAASGPTITRLGGTDDATATAIAVASAVGAADGVAVLVNETRFADGVSATAIAAGRRWPILLAAATTVPQRTVDMWRSLGVRRLVIVGGTSVINERIETFARDAGRCAGGAGCEVERLAGADRYATSVAVVQRTIALGGRTAASLLLGTGTSYADVLASGPLASQRKGLALLVDGTGAGADGASRAFLEANASVVRDVSILGGTGAVTVAADRALQAALGLH
jgi:putative cell wall-binding protein